MSTLAPKKEAFAQAVAAGAKLVDAYRQTRDCSKMQPGTIRSNAKKLAREPGVKDRIANLRRESKNEEFRARARGGSLQGSPQVRLRERRRPSLRLSAL
jgi:hypothetical protein